MMPIRSATLARVAQGRLVFSSLVGAFSDGLCEYCFFFDTSMSVSVICFVHTILVLGCQNSLSC